LGERIKWGETRGGWKIEKKGKRQRSGGKEREKEHYHVHQLTLKPATGWRKTATNRSSEVTTRGVPPIKQKRAPRKKERRGDHVPRGKTRPWKRAFAGESRRRRSWPQKPKAFWATLRGELTARGEKEKKQQGGGGGGREKKRSGLSGKSTRPSSNTNRWKALSPN